MQNILFYCTFFVNLSHIIGVSPVGRLNTSTSGINELFAKQYLNYSLQNSALELKHFRYIIQLIVIIFWFYPANRTVSFHIRFFNHLTSKSSNSVRLLILSRLFLIESSQRSFSYRVLFYHCSQQRVLTSHLPFLTVSRIFFSL